MLKGSDLIRQLGPKASYGTDSYLEACRWREELNQLSYAVRIVTRLKSGGNMSGLSAYRVTWWPNPG